MKFHSLKNQVFDKSKSKSCFAVCKRVSVVIENSRQRNSVFSAEGSRDNFSPTLLLSKDKALTLLRSMVGSKSQHLSTLLSSLASNFTSYLLSQTYHRYLIIKLNEPGYQRLLNTTTQRKDEIPLEKEMLVVVVLVAL